MNTKKYELIFCIVLINFLPEMLQLTAKGSDKFKLFIRRKLISKLLTCYSSKLIGQISKKCQIIFA